MAKAIVSCLSKNEFLMKCSERSILRAVFDAASVGLELGGPLGEAYAVPRYNKKMQQWECQLVIGYRGLITLARRNGDITIRSNVIYSNDEIDIDLAANTISHKPYLDGDRGEVTAVYCIAEFNDGSSHIDFMTRSDVDKVRARSESYSKKGSGPWSTDYDEMAKKTVVRRASKYWPLSADMTKAISMEVEQEESMVLDMPALEEGEIEALPEAKPKTKSDELTEKIKEMA